LNSRVGAGKETNELIEVFGIDGKIFGSPGIEAFLVKADSPPRRATGETDAPGSDDFLKMLEIAKRHGQVFLGGR